MIDYPKVALIVADELSERGYDPNVCILAARITTLALRELGETGVEAMAAEVQAFSPAYMEMVERAFELDRRLTEEELQPFVEAGAWSTVLSFGPAAPGQVDRRQGYYGHVVALVDRSWLIDPTLLQMSRPAKGLIIEPPLAWEIDYEQARTEGHVLLTSNGTVVQHKLIPGRKDFVKAPDWRMAVAEPVLGRIITRIDEEAYAQHH